MTQTNTNHHHIDLVDGDLTGAIIGAAIEVHTLLGPGFLELAYERMPSASRCTKRGIGWAAGIGIDEAAR